METAPNSAGAKHNCVFGLSAEHLCPKYLRNSGNTEYVLVAFHHWVSRACEVSEAPGGPRQGSNLPTERQHKLPKRGGKGPPNGLHNRR